MLDISNVYVADNNSYVIACKLLVAESNSFVVASNSFDVAVKRKSDLPDCNNFEINDIKIK